MEIYIENATTEAVVRFLQNNFSSICEIQEAGEAIVVNVDSGKSRFPVVITPGIEDTEFTSVWLNSDTLPWKTIGELAKHAEYTFGTRIRYEKADISPMFCEFHNGEKHEVNWE